MPLIYMPDTQFFDLILFGDGTVIRDLDAAKARGVRFVVPAQVMVELRAGINDPTTSEEVKYRIASKLAFIRDFGMEVQGESALTADPHFVRLDVREAYEKIYPQRAGKYISPAEVERFLKENPNIKRKLGTPVSSVKDTKVHASVRHYAANEGKGHEVYELTYEAQANEPARILTEHGVKLAPESQKLTRTKAKKFIHTHFIYELHPSLRGKMVSLSQRTPDGALAPLAKGPPMPSSPPRGTLTFRGKIGGGLKVVGGFLFDVIFRIFMMWAMKKLTEHAQKKLLEQEHKTAVNPQVIAALSAKKDLVLENLMLKKPAFAKITLRYFRAEDPPQSHTGGPQFQDEPHGPPENPFADIFTHVEFNRLVDIVDKKMDKAESAGFVGETASGRKLTTTEQLRGLPSFMGERITDTIEVTYSDEEVTLYSNFLELMALCTEQVAFIDTTPAELTSPDDDLVRKFWQKQHEFFRNGLNEALRTAPPPTFI